MDYMPIAAARNVLSPPQLDALRAKVQAGDTEVRSPAHRALPWPERTRREAEVTAWRHELEAAELAVRLDTERRAPVQPPRAAPAAGNAASAAQFAEPVPYFAPEHAAPQAAGNAAPVPTALTPALLLAPGYTAVAEHADGTGAILILRDEKAPKK